MGASSSKESPLEKAIKTQNLNLVKQLIDKGVDVNSINSSGDTPLLVATRIMYNKTSIHDIIKLLIEKGANIYYLNPNTQITPIDQGYNDILTLKIFINNGLNVNYTDHKGESLLQKLVQSNNYEMSKIIIEKGANVNYKNPKDNRSVISYINDNKFEIGKLLVDNGADKSLINAEYKTNFDKYLNQNLEDKYSEEQQSFLNSLSEKEKKILSFYTKFGDVIINNILRGNVTTENKDLMIAIKNFQENYPEYSKSTEYGFIRVFISDFLNIFKKAPKLKNELTVYRGIKNENYVSPITNELLSTSLSKEHALRFQGQSPCCLLTITLKPGIRTIYMAPISQFLAEDEVLVGPPFKVDSKEKTSNSEYKLTLSPDTYRKGGKTYRKKNKKSKKTKRIISY